MEVLHEINASLERLGVEQVDVYYFHAPFAGWDLRPILAAVNDAFKSRRFSKTWALQLHPAESPGGLQFGQGEWLRSPFCLSR